MTTTPDSELVAFAREAGLLGADDTGVWTSLTGGVSSDIWRLDAGGRSICVKRALAQLKVAADWRVPTARNLYEWRWIEWVARAFPGVVPEPLAMDEKRGAFAMAFLPATAFPLWKQQLFAGVIIGEMAWRVGYCLGAMHAKSAGDPALATHFQTDDLFHALRIEPYLLATAARHEDVGDAIRALARRTAQTKRVLVHGDVSPKNILMGRETPVFLDAECAWWGDPAFDAAFLINHLLLKQIALPDHAQSFSVCVEAFEDGYFSHVGWEPRPLLQARIAALTPALLLARIDGKSPVEYITEDTDKDRVRQAAKALIAAPPLNIRTLQAAFSQRTGLA
ncbi:MAG: aminoglycoside phosphotransferase family protein [Hyphomonadaceae bacterium]|nr:aminoglycoside phosphotransferase family protein [Hyphomonadaceae bacterium]